MNKKSPATTSGHTGPAFIVWFVPERQGAPWVRGRPKAARDTALARS